MKFLERIPGTRRRLYQFTAIDDCTRIRVLKIYDGCNQHTARLFIDEVLRRLPFWVHVVQTDNGAEFQSAFHWHLERLDIRHMYIRPRTPHLNGKVERSHRVDDQESTSSSTRTASATTSICSTRNCESGRTTTITIARTARLMAKPRTSACWRKRGMKRYRRFENLHNLVWRRECPPRVA